MRRALLLLATMAFGVLMVGSVALAKPIGGSADAKCAKLAKQTLGPSVTPANYTFIGGTAGDDNLSGKATAGSDVFCGFGGDDSISTLDGGDTFLGGDGNDSVTLNYGTFNGGAGDDYVIVNSGIFNGGDGNDSVTNDNEGTTNSVENLPSV